jgi:hypothetical protein
MADVVYVAASARDARFTRACVASIRRLYPEIPIKLLPGGPLERGLARVLRDYWDVGVLELPAGDYGWGLVKLEPLFGPAGERFMVLDSDTVMAGPVLDLWVPGDAAFLVDDQEQSVEETRTLYYDWEKVRRIDGRARPPSFVFNSGQWFGTAGILTRDDFARWIEWTLPRKLRHPECFMPGDQGVLNYVLNQKAALEGLDVKRQHIMRWPALGLDGLDLDTVSSRRAPPLVVHWAGMKRAFHRNTAGGFLLAYFESLFYRRLPFGSARKAVAACRYPLEFWWYEIAVRVRLRTRELRRRLAPAPASS